jgi:HTH-type transcriptional regulator / antitoxin HigA
MKLLPLASEKDHLEALRRIEELLDSNAALGSAESEELTALTSLVQGYESRVYPTLPPDPVQAILFRMEQQNLSQRDLVPFIGSRSKVSEVLSRKRPLTLSMIRALHFGLGIPASSLLTEQAPQEITFPTLDVSQFPLALMVKRGWIRATEWEVKNRPGELIEKFFSPVGSSVNLIAAYRTGEHIRSGRSMNEINLLAWKIRVAAKGLEAQIRPYEPGSVTMDFMRAVAELSTKDNAPVAVQDFLGEHGIAFCVEPHLPQTYLDGAAILSESERPIVGLTLRHDRLDNFWFTLMHELAHISCHLESGVRVFYDDLEVDSQSNAREREADAIAHEALIPRDVWQKSPASMLPSPEAAMHLAKILNIHPAIVAGQIRYRRNNYRLLPNLVGSGEVRRCFQDIDWSI